MDAATSIHRPSIPPSLTIPSSYFQDPIFGGKAQYREQNGSLNGLFWHGLNSDDVRKEQRASSCDSLDLNVASLCFSNMNLGSQEQLFTNNSVNSATSMLLPPHNVSQNVSQWPPSMSSSSGSATWMSSSSRGSSALPSPALMTQGSPPTSSSFDNGFDGALEMEKMVALARKLKMEGVLKDENDTKQEQPRAVPAFLPQQNVNFNRPNPPQQLNPNVFRNNRMAPPPIPQPPVRSVRSQMDVERAAAELWNVRTGGRRPSSAAAPFGSSRPRNHSLPEVYHGPNRSCPPPTTRAAVNTWRGFPPPPNDGNDGRRRGAEPLNQNANPYGRVDMRGAGDMDNSPYDGGMAQNPYANAAASPPTTYNRFDSRTRQNGFGQSNGNSFAVQKSNNPIAPRGGQPVMMNGPRNGMQKSVVNGQDNRVQDIQRGRAYPPSMLRTPTEDFFASETLENAVAAAECPQALQITKSFGGYGNGEGEFNMPQGLCLGDDDEIIVADTLNHRIQILDCDGAYRCHWGSPGVKKGQLWHPRKVAYIPETQHVVVSDRVNGCSRIQIFTRNGEYLTTLGNLHGLRMALNTTTAGLTVYKQQIVVVEVQPAACVVLTEDGGVVYWFPLDGVMVEPSDIVVINQKHYISDFRDHSVCVFDSWGHMIQRLGPSSPEGSLFIRYPRGLGVSAGGHLLIADTDLNRFHISVWDSETSLPISYHALLDVKVSHSCGVVMTKSGHIITAAKKEHTILILGFKNSPIGQYDGEEPNSSGSHRSTKSFAGSSGPIQKYQSNSSWKSTGLNVHAPVFCYGSTKVEEDNNGNV